MIAAPPSLPQHAGVGYKPEHFAAIRASMPTLGFFEVHAENYFGAGGPPHRQLTWLREHYALSLHGVGLSIGGEAPLDEAHLDRLAGLIERYQPASFSEHLAWSSHGDIYLNDLLPIAYDTPTLNRVCDHIDRAQERLKVRMLLENPSTYLGFAKSTMDEVDFIGEIARRTGCGLLLDVNNVEVTSVNHGLDPIDYIKRFSLALVGEIHLAGHAEDRDGAGERLLIDAHDRPVAPDVWALYAHVLSLTGALPTLIEWDNDVPPFDRLLAEAMAADALLKAVAPARAGGMNVFNPTTPDGQAAFTAALFDPDRPPPAGLIAYNGSDPARRFAVYRNNVIVSLVNALKAIFPITAELVGEDFFAAMAVEHVRRSPPRARQLATYGADFPAFIRGFAPAYGVPYLADVAAFEAARLSVYHAADEDALSPDALAARLGDDLAAIRFRFVDAHRVIASPFALFSLFAAHRGDLPIETVNPFEPEAVLITRVGDEVVTTKLPAATAAFLGALAAGEILAEAVDAAMTVDADLSLPHMLAALIGAGLITDILDT